MSGGLTQPYDVISVYEPVGRPNVIRSNDGAPGETSSTADVDFSGGGQLDSSGSGAHVHDPIPRYSVPMTIVVDHSARSFALAANGHAPNEAGDDRSTRALSATPRPAQGHRLSDPGAMVFLQPGALPWAGLRSNSSDV